MGGGGRGGAWGRLAPARRSCIIQQLHFRPASFLGVGVYCKLCLWDSPRAAAAALVYVFSVASSRRASARGRLRGCKRVNLRLLGIRSGSASRGRVPARQFGRRPGLASPRAQVAPAAPRTLPGVRLLDDRSPDAWGRRWEYWSGEAATESGPGTPLPTSSRGCLLRGAPLLRESCIISEARGAPSPTGWSLDPHLTVSMFSVLPQDFPLLFSDLH